VREKELKNVGDSCKTQCDLFLKENENLAVIILDRSLDITAYYSVKTVLRGKESRRLKKRHNNHNMSHARHIPIPG